MPVCGEGRGGSRGLPAPSLRRLAPTQLLCVNRAAAAPGKAGDAALVPEGCSGWSGVPAGLEPFLEPSCGVGGCCVTGGKGFGRGLPCVHRVVLHSRAGVGCGSSQSFWCTVRQCLQHPLGLGTPCGRETCWGACSTCSTCIPVTPDDHGATSVCGSTWKPQWPVHGGRGRLCPALVLPTGASRGC